MREGDLLLLLPSFTIAGLTSLMICHLALCHHNPDHHRQQPPPRRPCVMCDLCGCRRMGRAKLTGPPAMHLKLRCITRDPENLQVGR